MKKYILKCDGGYLTANSKEPISDKIERAAVYDTEEECQVPCTALNAVIGRDEWQVCVHETDFNNVKLLQAIQEHTKDTMLNACQENLTLNITIKKEGERIAYFVHNTHTGEEVRLIGDCVTEGLVLGRGKQ